MSTQQEKILKPKLGLVVPKDTSRTCPDCGFISESNRPRRGLYLCLECHYSNHADVVGAINIDRTAANQPGAATQGLTASRLI